MLTSTSSRHFTRSTLSEGTVLELRIDHWPTATVPSACFVTSPAICRPASDRRLTAVVPPRQAPFSIPCQVVRDGGCCPRRACDAAGRGTHQHEARAICSHRASQGWSDTRADTRVSQGGQCWSLHQLCEVVLCVGWHRAEPIRPGRAKTPSTRAAFSTPKRRSSLPLPFPLSFLAA